MYTSTALVTVERFHVCFDSFAEARQTFLSLVGTGPGLGHTPQRSNMTGLKVDELLE